MSETFSVSQRRRFPLRRVCRSWGLARSSVYAARKPSAKSLHGETRGRKPLVPDAALLAHVRRVLEDPQWLGEGYKKVHARLRHEGVRADKDRIRRLMGRHGLLAPTRVGRRRGPKAHDGTICTERPDEMWGTDATTILTRLEGKATVFGAVDHCSAECVGLHAARPGTRFEALEPLNQGIETRFGHRDEGVASGLKIRHDHGSQYTSHHFQKEIHFLGMESSPSYVREPQGNGCIERFFKTLKQQLLWVRTFDTVEELRIALIEFKDKYNQSWILEKHGYRTPNQVREEFDLRAAA